MYLGEVKIGNDLTFYANTHTPSTGAAVDADAAPTYSVYEDETGTAVASGTMALLDDAGTTGFYSESITLAAATYDAGKSYTIRITGVVGGVTGVELHQFGCAARATDDLAYPTVSGRSLDVTATGAAGVDWANVENPTTTVGLSGTTVKAVTDAVTPSAATIADAVWDEATADHAGAGSYGAWVTGLVAAITAALTAGVAYLAAIAGAVWTYATRTLTATAASTTAAVTGSALTITAGATYSATLSGMTIPADWLVVWFTLKTDEAQTDAQALVQLVESNPGVGTDGLKHLNGAAGTAAHGSLTVNQAGGTVAIELEAAATVQLDRASALGYDIKVLSGTDTVTLLTAGTASVQLTETKSIA